MRNQSRVAKVNTESLKNLFYQHYCERPIHLLPLPTSGSNRQYFRLSGNNHSAIGVFNPHILENQSYISFSNHFSTLGIRVPQVLETALTEHCYLLEDLGDKTLYALMLEQKAKGEFPKDEYSSALETLAFLQTKSPEIISIEKTCVPRLQFDATAILWDLNYFKYYFLKLGGFQFDENKLQDDFLAFANYLDSSPYQTFMYRDFQARNIMVNEGKLYFIDFQDGRFGPLQYDVASLLFQAKAEIPPHLREELLAGYLKSLKAYSNVNEKGFRTRYYDVALVRILQTLGAYGFRGFVERKPHFLSSFPYALKNIQWLLNEQKLNAPFPYLKSLLSDISADWLSKNQPNATNPDTLTVTINSFSYRNQIPIDYSGNGGGFVFDCRSLPNPGRLPEYKRLTGKDQPVINYLVKSDEVQSFINQTKNIVENAAQNYLERGFKNLMVNFGCTGGQHRSVYCAETLAEHLKSSHPVEVVLTHIEQEKKGWIN